MAARLASLSRQNLLLEFASLKYTCPEGVYVAITPGDASLWSGILFVRKGPYSPAILRFQVSFPSPFPASSPLITFSSDIFHPLLTPLTTYTYTTSTSDVDTVSATDDERLPPGGFSLRHGFPHWFGRSRDKTPGSGLSGISFADSATSQPCAAASPPTMYEVLEYLRSSFTDEAFLDSVPMEAAANSGAYHAWKTHRTRETAGDAVEPQAQPTDGRARSPLTLSLRSETPTAGRSRRPGEWNWEGVWEERVKRGVQNSLTEPVLFGTAVGGDDIIRFSELELESLHKIKQQMA
ncbi:hypothetical protein FKW77_008497 [Venturia effusa]|uniref:UBC core domain-containing protein n=1 Tax=Venturia effusa TaxID=50376 RepID=A0A517KX06_9PEZI|nr:hypothetical protein FKW77_008497 [Venturia effusa]